MNPKTKLAEAFRANITELTPVEWAEKNRVLTRDITNWAGPMQYKRTPYLIEIANSIMPNNSGQIFAIMKGSQIGFSIGGIFTMMGWVIGQSPSNMLFMVNDDAGIKRAMQGPVDQMINSSGIGHLIRAQNTRGGRNQKTGDTVKGKTFPNGNLYTWSGQAIGSLSQISVKYGFYDEMERYPVADKKAGSLQSLIEERHKSFADTRKLYFISTPEIKQTSRIEPVYLKGDQRKYHLPCKCCGEMIPLIWNKTVEGLDGKVGVIFDRKPNGELIEESVKYRCQKCGDTFDNTHLYDCYEDDLCKWFPTAKPFNPIYRSYQISALYAPAGMYNWKYYAQKWCEIHPKGGNIRFEELKTFVNQCLGETWEERGREIKTNVLIKNTRSYEIKTLPDALSIQDGNGKIVLLTCAIDLNGAEDDARLDYEVVAWSETGSSYSLDHGSIGTFERSKARRQKAAEKKLEEDESRIKWTYKINQKNNVWDEFKRTVMQQEYFAENEKKKLRVPIYGIDTGHFTEHANGFVYANDNCYALKGKVDNKFTKFDADKGWYEKSSKQSKLYSVLGDRVKDTLSDQMMLTWDESLNIEQPPGFMNFPNPTDGKYLYKSFFHEFEGEKREIEINDMATAIGARWVKKHSSSPNHYLDTRVYNMALRNIFADMMCKASKVPIGWDNFVKIFKKLL